GSRAESVEQIIRWSQVGSTPQLNSPDESLNRPICHRIFDVARSFWEAFPSVSVASAGTQLGDAYKHLAKIPAPPVLRPAPVATFLRKLRLDSNMAPPATMSAQRTNRAAQSFLARRVRPII